MDPPPTSRGEGSRVYRSSPRVRALLGGIFACFVAIGPGLWWIGRSSGDVGTQHAGLIVGAILLAIFGPLFWMAGWHHPRLILGTRTLVLRQLGWRLETTWDNVASLVRHGGTGLILKKPMGCRGANTLAAFSEGTTGAHTPLEEPYILERRYIPLKLFGYWLHHGDLEAELRARVPGLLEIDLRAKDIGAAGAGSRAHAWLLWTFVALIIVAAALAGIFFGDSPGFNRGVAYARAITFFLLGGFMLTGSVAKFRQKRPLTAAGWIIGGCLLLLVALASIGSSPGE